MFFTVLCLTSNAPKLMTFKENKEREYRLKEFTSIVCMGKKKFSDKSKE